MREARAKRLQGNGLWDMGVPVNEIDQMAAEAAITRPCITPFQSRDVSRVDFNAAVGSSTLSYDKQNTSIKDPSEWFEVASEEARIEDVSWHSLRPTFASRSLWQECLVSHELLKCFHIYHSRTHLYL
jgi:hypothetical protein